MESGTAGHTGARWYAWWQTWAVAAAAALVAAALAVFAVFPALGADAAARQRAAAVQDYIALQEDLFPDYYPEGSISSVDHDGFIEIVRVQQRDGSTALPSGQPGRVADDQLGADMLAFQAGCPVLICDYLADGFLYAMQVGYPDAAARQQGAAADAELAGRMDQVAADADAFAEGQQQRLLEERCAQFGASDGAPGYAGASYTIEPDAIWIDVAEAPGFGFGAYLSDDDYAAAVKAWEEAARTDARCLRRDVGYRFSTSDGALDLQVIASVPPYYLDPRSEDGS